MSDKVIKLGNTITAAQVAAAGGTTAASAIADNVVARGDGGVRGLQGSAFSIDDSGNISGVGTMSIGNQARTLVGDPGYFCGRTVTGTSSARAYGDYTAFQASGALIGCNSYDAQAQVGTGTQTIDHVASYQSRPNVSVATVNLIHGYHSTGTRGTGGGLNGGSTEWQDFVAVALTGGATLAARIVFNDSMSASDATNIVCLRSFSGARSYHLGTWSVGAGGFSSGDQNYFLNVANTSAIANKGSFKVIGYSVTGSSTRPMMSWAGTLNTSGVVEVITMDITNTASNAASRLMSLKTGGTQRFGVGILGDIQLDKTITAGGTTGNQTINKPMGSVNFAAAATSLTLTNSLLTVNSIVQLTLATNDTTCTGFKYTPGAGSIVIRPTGGAPAAEARCDFVILN